MDCFACCAGMYGDTEKRLAYGERLKIIIFNLGICDAARPKVPTDLDAACAAE